MPELPEVETTVRALRAPLVGRTLTHVRNYWPGHIARPSLPELKKRIRGRRVEAIGRRGKYLVFSLSEREAPWSQARGASQQNVFLPEKADHSATATSQGTQAFSRETLIIHLKMTGHLSVVDKDQPVQKHVHTIFALANGQELRFRDQRKFGRVYLVHDPEEVLGKLGPEPLESSFTVEVLQERFKRRKRALKPLLLDQGFIAGIGNIYADEALFYAGLHPERRANSLSVAEIASLHAAIQKVLRLGIEREGASLDIYVKPDGSRGDMQNTVAVFRRTGQPCYRCGTIVQRIVMGGRSTHFCPTCQSIECQ
jgi:formamidopyrimidine-DNA glycosylase